MVKIRSSSQLTDRTWIPLGLACVVGGCVVVVTAQFTTVSQQAKDAYAMSHADHETIVSVMKDVSLMSKHLENIDVLMERQLAEQRRGRAEVFKKLGISPETLEKIQE